MGDIFRVSLARMLGISERSQEMGIQGTTVAYPVGIRLPISMRSETLKLFETQCKICLKECNISNLILKDCSHDRTSIVRILGLAHDGCCQRSDAYKCRVSYPSSFRLEAF